MAARTASKAATAAPKLFGNKKQLSEDVAAHLRESIMAGELRATSFIRTEHLAAELGVSATPVREALMALQSEGTIRWEPRRGFRVLPLSRQDVEDLFAVQAYIAGELAARAATLMDASDVDRLRTLQKELEEAARAGDAETVDAVNHEIHRSINRTSKAQRLTSLLGIAVNYVPRNYYGKIEGWAEASSHDHDPIFHALESGDSEAARTAMAEHIRHIGVLLVDHLENKGVFSAAESPEDATGTGS
ncbi:GntR family transcriptional regulator [Arthrobacter sp. AFG20]|uniref:GntR family transcriptional regulator n=1 Tax=Arthrobacter sp. AFG20 TaxID=1688671 RepID=UPI000C9EB213|nr:GntR family transcriptional regulator [Arthrobacter sp. AFG20]PNH78163.1 GntR family transcriptional regulator [Arthrobacter sp. AFG20]